MSRVPKWFERRFAFPLPVAMLPNLRARLRGTPARLEEVLRGSPHEVLIEKPVGQWSAQEHAGHLLELESLWIARIGDYAAACVQQLTPADLSNRGTDEANFNARPLDEILRDFRGARGTLLKAIEASDAAMLEKSLPHPRLQTPMRVVDHLFFVAEHDDHHLARIWEIVSAAS